MARRLTWLLSRLVRDHKTIADFRKDDGAGVRKVCARFELCRAMGLTMQGSRTGWEEELGRWLVPFLERLGHQARRRMCPLYVAGLIGGSQEVAPIAERFAPGHYDRLHDFVAGGLWDAAPLETSVWSGR